jgi:hypothetical protein
MTAGSRNSLSWRSGRASLSGLVSMAVCAGVAGCGGTPDRFAVSTPDGVVLASVEGASTGFTNTELTRLVRAGVAEAYPVQCHAPSWLGAGAPLMVWQVVDKDRQPTAIVSVRLIRNGTVVRSSFDNVVVPDANPGSVFMRTVSDLARRVLPPATSPPTMPDRTMPDRC